METDVLRTILVYALPVLFAITLQEAAHGYAARWLGDPTAAEAGRLSVNPFRHIDLLGTIVMPLVLYLATSGQFIFGYAKPVPIDVTRLRHPRRDMAWIGASGPACSLLQAVAWALFGTAQLALGASEPFFLLMAKAGVLVNLVMFALNLLPVPPLDGGRILVGLLPLPLARVVARIEPYGFFVVLGLVIGGVLSTWWIQPLLYVMLGLMLAVFPSLNAVFAVPY